MLVIGQVRRNPNLSKQNEMAWTVKQWHEIDENGIKPNKEKVKAILDLKHPENPKQLKSFPVAN